MPGENPQTTLPPVPREPMIDRTGQMSQQWSRWIQQIQRVLSFSGGVAWVIINKTGSRLSDIETRTHAMLQSVLGWTDDADTAQVKHISNANGKKWEDHVDVADGNPHGTDHDMLDGLDADDHAQYLLLAGRAGQRVVTPLTLGTATDNTTFEADGSQKMNGSATVWRDDNFAAVSLGLGATPPDSIPINGGTIEVRAFDGVAITEQLFFGTEYNHEAKEGADIVFHLHWSPTTAGAGNVKWQLTYKWINIDGSFAGAETTISVTQASGGVAWSSNKVSFPAVSGAGKTIGSQIVGRLFRDPTDAADTYAADAAITATFGIHYEIDSNGSRQITTK
jgi:hypothetical protein